MNNKIIQFQEKIGYQFQHKAILEDALKHSSYAGSRNHEFDRMEYLGDAVLELIISTYLYTTFSDYTEGMLTKVRTGIVSEGALSEAAKLIGIPAVVMLGKGEEHSGGREKPSILSDVFEAVVGAVYLDGGLQPATDFVLSSLKGNIIHSIERGGVEDYKTKLQEHIQSFSQKAVEYTTQTLKTGTNPEFEAVVAHEGKELGRGRGGKKKTAEQEAAKAALEKLGI
ncbi:ribonuclease III [Clostridia bacterium OttesenSCG-928-F22]|nr:ribonuclease III [Clostridia bacterium OttesenSCG-928-F22]